MSYSEAMEAAGAHIIAFQEFGSYQGDWWALVRYEREIGWVHGYYGSCSGCDAFQAELDYNTHEECEDHRWEHPKPAQCDACDAVKKAYQQKLAEFGKSYLVGGFMTQEEAIKESLEYDWDSDAGGKTKEGEMTEFIREEGSKVRI